MDFCRLPTWGQTGWGMMQMLDCLVSYFGLDEEARSTYRRYFLYHIVAGPGATTGSGVASIATLAIYDNLERCTSCQHFHVVNTGGPAAAIARAIQYLDAYHAEDRLRKVQSEIRGLGRDLPATIASSAGPDPAAVTLFDGDATPRRQRVARDH
jgi:hypothetical protein